MSEGVTQRTEDIVESLKTRWLEKSGSSFDCAQCGVESNFLDRIIDRIEADAEEITRLRQRLSELDWCEDMERAPRDGTEFVAWNGMYAFKCKLQPHYVKFPHEEGGPTFRDEWISIRPGVHLVERKPLTHWRPLPASPTRKGD